jgi:hypothetical protein
MSLNHPAACEMKWLQALRGSAENGEILTGDEPIIHRPKHRCCSYMHCQGPESFLDVPRLTTIGGCIWGPRLKLRSGGVKEFDDKAEGKP